MQPRNDYRTNGISFFFMHDVHHPRDGTNTTGPRTSFSLFVSRPSFFPPPSPHRGRCSRRARGYAVAIAARSAFAGVHNAAYALPPRTARFARAAARKLTAARTRRRALRAIISVHYVTQAAPARGSAVANRPIRLTLFVSPPAKSHIRAMAPRPAPK